MSLPRSAMLMAVVCVVVAGAGLVHGATEYEVLQSNLSPDLPRVTLRLDAMLAGSDQESVARSRTTFETESVPRRFANRTAASYSHYVNLGVIHGKTYHAFTRLADTSKCLARSASEIIDLLVVAEPGKGQGNLTNVVEGWLTLGNEVTVPLREKITPVGANGLTDLPFTIALTFNSRSVRGFGGSMELRSRLSAQGSQVLGSTRLTVTVSPILDVPASPSQPWSASLTGVVPGTASKSAAGTLRDSLSLGSAKIVAEKIAKDFSEIVVAVVDGDLNKLEAEPPRKIEELPDFARVEFFGRRLVSRDDVLSAAASTGHVVLVFGELLPQNNPFMGAPNPYGSALTLGVEAVLDTVNRDLEEPSPVIFVVRSVNLSDLFEKYLDKQPPYFLLSDYADALTSQFFGKQTPYFFPSFAGQRKSLRGDMGFADNNVAVVVADKDGRIKYLNDNAGGDLRTALLAANKVLRGE